MKHATITLTPFVRLIRFVHLAIAGSLCIVLFGPAKIFAQIGEHRSELGIGVSGGVVMNQISFDPKVLQSWHNAPTFGVTFRYTCEKYYSAVCALQVELNYARMGWKEAIESSANEPLPDRYSRHLDYIQLPFLARLSWGKEEQGAMFFFLLGFQAGYCFSEKSVQSDFTYNDEGYPDRPNDRYEQYYMDIDHKFDYGITAGLGLEIRTNIGHFSLEGRYYYALSDIYGNSKSDVFERSAHGAIYIKASYLVNIKLK